MAHNFLTIKKIKNNNLTISKDFVYLGITFSKNGINSHEHIKRTQIKAYAATALLKSVGCHAGGLSLRNRSRLYVSMVRPILEYGLWLLTLSNAKNLESTQHRILCSLLGIGPKSSSEKVLSLLRILPILYRKELMTVKWLRRVESRPMDHSFMICEALLSYRLNPVKKISFFGRGFNSSSYSNDDNASRNI